MNTPTESTEDGTSGDASPTSPTPSDMSPPDIGHSHGPSRSDHAYAFLVGFVVTACVAALVALLIVWAVKVTEGIDGE